MRAAFGGSKVWLKDLSKICPKLINTIYESNSSVLLIHILPHMAFKPLSCVKGRGDSTGDRAQHLIHRYHCLH